MNEQWTRLIRDPFYLTRWPEGSVDLFCCRFFFWRSIRFRSRRWPCPPTGKWVPSICEISGQSCRNRSDSVEPSDGMTWRSQVHRPLSKQESAKSFHKKYWFYCKLLSWLIHKRKHTHTHSTENKTVHKPSNLRAYTNSIYMYIKIDIICRRNKRLLRKVCTGNCQNRHVE